MYEPVYRSGHHPKEHYRGKHRYEHWYIDTQVYFITARCRNRCPAFASKTANTIFWDRFEHYTAQAGFIPWVTSLIDNHYHTLGYLRESKALGRMMQGLHGSTSKLVNDLLPKRLKPFWRAKARQDYFDGANRDERQCRPAYRYT